VDKKALFGEVDFAVEEALNARISKLDTLELDEWTTDLLKEDTENVNLTIAQTCEKMGWTSDEYSDTFLRIRRNRHTPKTVSL
jgi:hypothetical protein